MSEIAHSRAPGRAQELHPPRISAEELWPWTLLAVALLALVYVVTAADGAFVHEYFHDGRHLLAFPCD